MGGATGSGEGGSGGDAADGREGRQDDHAEVPHDDDDEGRVLRAVERVWKEMRVRWWGGEAKREVVYNRQGGGKLGLSSWQSSSCTLLSTFMN